MNFVPAFPFVLGVARIQLLKDDLAVTHGVADFRGGLLLTRSAAQRRYSIFPRAFLAQSEFVLRLTLRGMIIIPTRVVTRCLGVCNIRFAVRGRARAQNIDSIIQLRQLLRVQRLEGTTGDESAVKKVICLSAFLFRAPAANYPRRTGSSRSP